MRILIVDDQVSVAKGLQQACKKKGWTAELAFSAEEALNRVRELRFDGLVSDLRMPGLSGLDLATEVLAGPSFNGVAKPFFILISAYLTLEDSLKALRLGVADVFQKPFEMESLLNRMGELGRSRGNSEKTPVDVESPKKRDRSILGWDEYFCMEQRVKALGSQWNYVSFPIKNGSAVRVGIGFNCSPLVWARLEGALLLSLDRQLPQDCFFEFLTMRFPELGWDSKKCGLVVLDFEDGKLQGQFCGNLQLKTTGGPVDTRESSHFKERVEMVFKDGNRLQWMPLIQNLAQEDSSLFTLSLKPRELVSVVLNLARGSWMEGFSYFSECLAQRDWDYTVQMKSLSCLAEILNRCQDVGMNEVRLGLDQNRVYLEGKDLSCRLSGHGNDELLANESLLRLPSSKEFLKKLLGDVMKVEGDVLSFSLGSGGLS